MSSENIIRRLTGAVKNAIAWGVAWFALAFATILLLRTIGVVVPPSVSALDALGMAIKFGVMGGITGGAFSIFISFFYRGRRLSQINWVRFALGGAVVAGVFVPSFLVLANVLTGGPIPPFDAIRGDIIFSALFGGIAAGASMWLAQRGETSSLGGGRRAAAFDTGARPRVGEKVERALDREPPRQR
jgi:hypothetical protein